MLENDDIAEQVTKLVKSGSVRQRNLAKAVSDSLGSSKPVTKIELFKQAGYAVSTANQQTAITTSPGFLLEMSKLGLTKEFVVSALYDDIKNKPGRRAFELSTAGKWLGLEQRNTPEQHNTAIQNAVIIIQRGDDKGRTTPISRPIDNPPSAIDNTPQSSDDVKAVDTSG